MFRSLCVLLKQIFLPLSAAQKLWGVSCSVAREGILRLLRINLLSVERNERSRVLGLRIHDVVHDRSVEMAEEAEEMMLWHENRLEGHRYSTTLQILHTTIKGKRVVLPNSGMKHLMTITLTTISYDTCMALGAEGMRYCW